MNREIKWPLASKALSFLTLCATGYWFCKNCSKITDVDLDEPHPTCQHCGCSHKLQRIDPVPGVETNFRKARA